MSLKLGGALVMALASLLATPAGPSAHVKPQNYEDGTTKPPVVFIVIAGRVKRQCKGHGICQIVTKSNPSGDREVRAKLHAKADGKVTVQFLDKPPEEGPTLFIDEDITAPPAVASKLGFKSVTLLKGEYSYNSRRSVIDARLAK
jgi:hypothetical protein